MLHSQALMFPIHTSAIKARQEIVSTTIASGHLSPGSLSPGCVSPAWSAQVSLLAACLISAALNEKSGHHQAARDSLASGALLKECGGEIWCDEPTAYVLLIQNLTTLNIQNDPLWSDAVWSGLSQTRPEYAASVLWGGLYAGGWIPEHQHISAVLSKVSVDDTSKIIELIVRRYASMTYHGISHGGSGLCASDVERLLDLLVAHLPSHECISGALLQHIWLHAVDILGPAPGCLLSSWLIRHTSDHDAHAALLWLACQDDVHSPHVEHIWPMMCSRQWRGQSWVFPWCLAGSPVERVQVAAILSRLPLPSQPDGARLIRHILDHDAITHSVSAPEAAAPPRRM